MSAGAPKRRALIAYLPLILFAALAAVFLVRLFAGDPTKLPSALIGKPVPVFSLPAVDGHNQPGFTQVDLAKGRVTLVNVFASWCAPCQQEHPLLMELAKDTRFQIAGINQKDKAENARRFLGKLGNPYAFIGADTDGRASIEWGVYGVPETFVVTGDGKIAFKHVGPLTEESLQGKLLPAIEKALAGR
ncbi:MAG: DsbE family thiol:disulfide interchange protein [Rhizobiales bacterium PAR1]|nr:MAG: DsbE family thiol:disulfide interchange protein [Rhizobiales bacterium PAR1]